MIKDHIHTMSFPHYKLCCGNIISITYNCFSVIFISFSFQAKYIQLCLIWWLTSLSRTFTIPSNDIKSDFFYLLEATWSSAQWDRATSKFASLRSKMPLSGFSPSCWKQSVIIVFDNCQLECLKVSWKQSPMETTCSCNPSSVLAALCPESGPTALSAGLASWSLDKID